MESGTTDGLLEKSCGLSCGRFCPEGVPLIRSEAKVEAWALRGSTKAVMFLGHHYPVQCLLLVGTPETPGLQEPQKGCIVLWPAAGAGVGTLVESCEPTLQNHTHCEEHDVTTSGLGEGHSDEWLFQKRRP